MLILVIVGNLFYQRANGSEAQPGRVGITEDDIDDADKSLSSFFNIGSFLVLPLILLGPETGRLLCSHTDIYCPGDFTSRGTKTKVGYRYHTFIYAIIILLFMIY